MAERRMFAKTIIDSDAFLDMPQSTQLLYFHLAMRADDDGFINNPRAIMRNTKCNEDDVKLLIAKKFIIPFESGVVVIKHWKIHNYIAKDRYKETKYKEEKSTLMLDENKAYTQTPQVPCIQDVYNMDTQDRIGKDRIGKVSVDDEAPAPPTKAEVEAYVAERGNKIDAGWFFDYYDARGWMTNGNPVTDWKARVVWWENHETKYQKQHKASFESQAFQQKAQEPIVYKPRGDK